MSLAMSPSKSKSTRPKRTLERAQNKIRRVLQLLDTLAHLRTTFTIREAIQLLEDKTGTIFNVHEKTIQRDLDLLESLNLIYIHQKAEVGSHKASSQAKYKVDPVLSKNLIAAAAKLNGPKGAKQWE